MYVESTSKRKKDILALGIVATASCNASLYDILTYTHTFNWESLAGYVIQDGGTVEFEDGLKVGVLLGGC